LVFENVNDKLSRPAALDIKLVQKNLLQLVILGIYNKLYKVNKLGNNKLLWFQGMFILS